MKDWERKFETWKMEYDFWASVIVGDGDPKWYKAEVKVSKKFEQDLVALCRKYGFDPLGKLRFVGDDLEDGAQLDAGRTLGPYVGAALIEVINVNRRYRKNFSHKQPRRHGPKRTMSQSQAETLLVGLKLLEGSRAGLEMIRRLVGAHDNRSDIRLWKDQQALYLQRLILSEGKKRVIVNFGDVRAEQEKLLKRVAARADAIARRSQATAA